MLVKGQFAKELKSFITSVNKLKQEDQNKAIESFANRLEELIDERIKSITLTIPTGFIQVQGSPSAQTNIAPIVLNNVVK